MINKLCNKNKKNRSLKQLITDFLPNTVKYFSRNYSGLIRTNLQSRLNLFGMRQEIIVLRPLPFEAFQEGFEQCLLGVTITVSPRQVLASNACNVVIISD